MTKLNESPRWRRTPEERPRQILEAGLAVFGEQGLAAARLDDIAERAGISKGTIYLYFQSKDDLFREVIRDAYAEVVEVVEVPETEDPQADLFTFCRSYWSILRSPRFETVHRLVLAESQAFPEVSQEYGREVRDRMKRIVRAILDRASGSGVFTRGDNQMRARMLLALLWQHGIWYARRQNDPELVDRSDSAVLNDVITFFLEAVATRR